MIFISLKIIEISFNNIFPTQKRLFMMLFKKRYSLLMYLFLSFNLVPISLGNAQEHTRKSRHQERQRMVKQQEFINEAGNKDFSVTPHPLNLSAPQAKFTVFLLTVYAFNLVDTPKSCNNDGGRALLRDQSRSDDGDNALGKCYLNQTLSSQKDIREYSPGAAHHQQSLRLYPVPPKTPNIVGAKKARTKLESNKLPQTPEKVLVKKLSLLSKEQKKGLYDKLEIAFRKAEICDSEVEEFKAAHGVEGIISTGLVADYADYQNRFDTCHSIINGWKKLRPLDFKKRAFSIKPSSESFIVNQRQYAIANHDDPQYVLMTGDIMKCIGLAFYNPEIKRGGLAHIDGENLRSIDSYLDGTLDDNMCDLEQYLLDVARETPFNKIEATLISGFAPHINYFYEFLKDLGVRNFKIIYNSRWGTRYNSYYNDSPKGSLAIDCRDGNLWAIDNEPTIRKKMGPPPPIANEPRPLLKVK